MKGFTIMRFNTKKYSIVGILLFLTLILSLSVGNAAVEKKSNTPDLFEERMVYFDRAIDREENFTLIKKVILKAEKLGFNALVLNEEFLYARLPHKNPVMDKIKDRLSQIEQLAHAHGLRLIVMHFNAEVPTFVVKDPDPANHFYKNGKFDFSEANKAVTTYKVIGDIARVDASVKRREKRSFFDGMYHFDGTKPNTEYRLTMIASTKGYDKKVLKVSVLDEDHRDENGKVIFGIQKYFREIVPNAQKRRYSVYFNSLNHKNLQGKIKVYLSKQPNINVEALELKEIGYHKKEHVVREQTAPMLLSKKDKKLFVLDSDYRLRDDTIVLLSDAIKKEKYLELIWYPRVDVSRFYDHETTSDICADEALYHAIMIDQYKTIKIALNGKVDGIAFNDDEWREAGWDEACQKLYAKEYQRLDKTGNFTGGDYIGISTRRMIKHLVGDSKLQTYVMGDMFDPNFNAKDPYMGVKDGAVGAIDYLPKETRVFNWFPNPYEPGLENKSKSDFLKSAKFFSDHGISQIIAGYHDDMKNLDSNIAFYKDSSKRVQESIVGFMFLIWHQPGKNATYDDMDKVVKKICHELPGKWPQSACK